MTADLSRRPVEPASGVAHLVRPLNSRSAATPPLIGVFPRGERGSQVASLISPSALQSSTRAYKLENSAKHGDRTLSV